MARSHRFHLLAVAAALGMYAGGIGLFSRGFFLTRVELANVSSFSTPASHRAGDDSTPFDNGEEDVVPLYAKAVIVVIDAWRRDFADAFVTVRHLLEGSETANASHLWRFIADPPTTTLQRLKGMTTGGMPTFIDIKDDVSSSEVAEDSVVRQLSAAGRSVVFMGDDTWVKLFPRAFERSYPFPSFDVVDLHTVDNGVIANLVPEIRGERGPWDVIIAHFLGVDHIGHRIGASNPTMVRKLHQLDDALNEVVRAVDAYAASHEGEDILLLVFGDHGMTSDGNHGGASREEVEAALFAYTTRPGAIPSSLYAFDEVAQIDLAPTLAMLLGVPVPFGNLGRVIPSFFGSSLRRALKRNVAQVLNYLDEYLRVAGDVSELEDVAAELRELPADAGEAEMLDALKRAADAGRHVWTRFDLPMMRAGIALIAAGFALNCMVALCGSDSSERPPSSPSAIVLVSAGAAIFAQLAALCSNSYIVAEEYVLLFALSTVCVALAVRCLTERVIVLQHLIAIAALAISARAGIHRGAAIMACGQEPESVSAFESIAPLAAILTIDAQRGQLLSSRILAVIIATQFSLVALFWLHFRAVVHLPRAVYALGALGAGRLGSLLAPLALLLGPASPPTMLIIYVQIASIECLGKRNRIIGALLAFLCSSLGFFSTGHTCQFNTLHYAAPFVGFTKFEYWRGAFMLTANTFGAYILFIASLGQVLASSKAKAILVGLFAAKMLVTTAFVYAQRRHLMVWAIFAPKYVFDVSAFVVVAICASSLAALERVRTQ